MGFADLHVHTMYSSDGTCSVSAILKQASDYIGLNVIAITDHDEIRGAQEALQLAPAYNIEVIPGCEITTSDGHLIALFINKKIPAGLPLERTLHLIGEQGGIAIAPHPEARYSGGMSGTTIRRGLLDPEAGRVLVGIEVFNSGLIHGFTNAKAQKLAKTLPLAKVSSSDAHLLWMMGRGMTYFQGTTAASLRQALETGTTRPIYGSACNGFRIIGSWLWNYSLRMASWVIANPEPQASLKLVRLANL